MEKPKIRKSTILTGVNAVGVILTAYLSSKAALKAKEALDEFNEPDEELDLKDKVKIAAPYYIPTVISAAGTIAAGVAANKIDGVAIAGLGAIGAKAVKDLKDYRKVVIDTDGPEKDQQYRKLLAERTLIDDQSGDLESKYWFYEPWSELWFEACKADVYTGLSAINQTLIDPNTKNYGTPTLSDFYEGCGRPDLVGPEQSRLGWDLEDLEYNCDCYWLEFWLDECDDDGEPLEIQRGRTKTNRPKYRIDTFWGPEYLDVIDTQLRDAGYRD